VALGAQSGAFDSVLSGLSPGGTYFFRAFAQNSAAGVFASPTLSFEVLPLPPVVENVAATNILGASAEIGANVTSTGGNPPTVTLFYGTTDGGATAGSWDQSVALGVQSGAASAAISGLMANTGYFFRARAVNAGGTVWASASAMFSTPSITLPMVVNLAATGVTGISAVLRGDVTDIGADPPAVTIHYGRVDELVVAGNWESFVQIGVQTGAFSRFVGNLVPESTYYFRAFASNAAGDVWASPSLSFVTPVYVAPTIVINEIHYDEVDKTVRGEFIEICNLSGSDIDLTGWTLSGAVDYTFGSTIAGNGYLVVAEDPTEQAGVGPWVGNLRNSGETIVLRDPVGNVVDSVDYKLGFPWPIVGDLVGGNSPSIQLINPLLENDQGGAWRSATPTPGAQNAVFASNAPPSLRQVNHVPTARVPGQDETVLPGEDVRISVRASDADGVSAVTLDYQAVNPGDYIDIDDARYASSWTTVSMNDSGTGGDVFAGDEVFSTTIPGSVNTHRRLIRYRIHATDSASNSVQVPYADDASPNFAYFVYGAVPAWTASDRPGVAAATTYDFSTMEPISMYQLLTTRSDHEEAQHIPNAVSGGYGGSDYLWQGSLVYEGKVYDHIRFRARGGVWRYSMGKNMWKFDFNRGHRFAARDDSGKKYRAEWNKLNFSSLIQQGNFQQRGEQGLFEGAGFKNHNLAGSPAPKTHYVHFRIIENADENGPTSSQFDTDFQGLYMAVEQLDGQFTDEHNLPDGYLWKIEGGNNQDPPNNQGSYLESSLPNGDVDDFINGVNGVQSAQWWKDHLNLEGYYKFRANASWVHDYDIHAGKNYFYYHNPVTDKWQVVNWDLDLTWTTTYGGGGETGPLSSDVLAISEFQLGFRNEVRHLQDLLHNSEQQGMLLDEIAHWVYTPGQNSMVDADRAMWDYNPILTSGYINGSKAGHGRYYEAATTPTRTFPGMVAKLKTYVAGRQTFMTNTYLNADEASIPAKPTITYAGAAGFPTNTLSFTSSAFSGSSFAAQKWRIAEVTLPSDPRFDPNDVTYDRYAERLYEIDAKWESADLLTTDYAATIPAVEVRPGRLYRVRTKMLDSEGRWSHWSEPIEFTTTQPDLSEYIDSLRITEFMYNPPEPTGAETLVSTNRDDFEFIELKNVGVNPIDLRDVRFTKGVDFDFAGSAVEILAPGAYVLIVKNSVAFEARYGAGLPVAGEFTLDNLSNGGERLKLSFGAGSTIHDIDEYDDKAPWPEFADGAGFSLTLVSPDAVPGPDHDVASSWRPSRLSGGTPGAGDAYLYSDWRTANGIVDDEGDDDGDKIVNFLEFALGADHIVPDTEILPTGGILMITGIDYASLTFRRQLGADDLVYTVEFSPDLTNWSASGVLASVVDEGGGIVSETWRAATPASATDRDFVRLKVLLP
jgi:hypothetical protein